MLAAYIGGGALVLGALGAAYYETRLATAEAALQTEKAGRATDLDTYREAAIEQASAFRAKETGWQANKEESERVAQLAIQSALDAAVRADGARSRVQQRADSLASACYRPTQGPTAVPGRTDAANPGLLLADVFGRSDTRSGQLARYSDTLRAAGEACNREHDTVSQ